MINFVLRKIRSTGPCKSLALVLPVIIVFAAWLLIIMTAKEDDVIPEPKKNKLEGLIGEISCYIWKGSRRMEEPKYTYIQRMWNYFN